jgi:hypothetical protein
MKNVNNLNEVLRESAIDVVVPKGAQIQASELRTDFIFPFGSDSVDEFIRQGDDLLIVLDDGQTILIVDFYVDGSSHAFVFQDVGGAIAVPWGLIAGGGILGVGALAALGGGDDEGGNNSAVATVNNAGDTLYVGGDNSPYTVDVSGTGELGDTVTVTVGDQTGDVSIGDDGLWEITFDGDDLPSDGEWETLVVVDHVGGDVTDLDGPNWTIDTVAPEIEITSGIQATGDIFNGEELDGGATISGTGEAGANLVITLGQHTQTTTVGENASWTVTWPAGTFEAGEYTSEMTIVATDAIGNAATTTATIEIDTISEVSIATSTVADDGTINGAEQSVGVNLTGTAQAGSTVVVTFGTTTLAATVDANGNWTVDFPPSAIATGEYDATVTAVATDANGNSSTSTGTIQVDTFVNEFGYTSTPGGADGVINASEVQAGLIVTGTAEAGSTVSVVLDGVTQIATVNADGSWSATYGAGQLALGTYTAQMVATATDAAGNTSTITQTVNVDTDAGSLTISANPIEVDDIINAAEASDGVVLSGTSDAGAIVQVTMGGVTHSVVTNAAGVWQANFAADEIAQGTYIADITATTTDAAGNTRTVIDSVNVDTRVDNLSISADIIEGDNVVTGTTEIGSTVVITIGGQSVNAVVDANGNWTADFTAAQIPTGEYTTDVSVTATDAAGNVASVFETVWVDTLVNELSLSSTPIEGDNVVNQAEASDGINLSGRVEPGSTVMVDFEGTTMAANVDASGNWSIAIPASAILAGSYDADITVMATDAVGNTATIADTLAIDTDAPEGPVIASYTRDGDGISGVSMEISADDLSVAQVNADGSITNVAATQVDILVFGETNFQFNAEVPDGSTLIVFSTDDAGNASGTYVVLDAESANSTVDISNASLGNYQIETVDLQFSEEAHLIITEAQLVGLADGTDTLKVRGGSDDEVTIIGANQTGSMTGADGQTYDVYSLGEATVLFDDDITVNTGVIG